MPSPWMALLASALGGNVGRPVQLPSPLKPDWVEDALLRARAQGLEFFLVEALRTRHGAGTLALEPGALAALEARRKVLLRRSLMWDQVLDEVLGLIDPEGSRGVLVLKGGGLRHMLYAEPASRELKDLDLLLPPELMAEAGAALERAGWRQELEASRYDVHNVREYGGVTALVELHRGLDKDERCRLRWQDLQGQSLEVEAPGYRFRVPGLAHQALVALIHARKHVFILPLKSVLDYKLVLQALDKRGEVVVEGPEWALPGLPATHFVLDLLGRTWLGQMPDVKLPLAPLPWWHRALLQQAVDPWRVGYFRGIPCGGLARPAAVHGLLVGPGPASARELGHWVGRRTRALWSPKVSS